MGIPSQLEMTEGICRDRSRLARELWRTHDLRMKARRVMRELDEIRRMIALMPDGTVDQRRAKMVKAREFEGLSDWYGPERWMSTMQRRPMYVTGDIVYRNGTVIGVIGGNQSSKTISGVTGLALYLRDHAPAGSKGWCVAPSAEKSIARQQATLYDLLPSKLLGDAEYTPKNGFGSVRPTLVVDPDDRKIVVRFKATAQFDKDPRSFESEDLDWVWIDESIEDKHYQALLPRLVAKDGMMLITTVPDVAWLHEHIAEAPPESDVRFHKMTIYANRRNLAPGTIEKMKSRMSADEAEMRIYGNFRYLEGLVYNEFIREPYPRGNIIEPSMVPADVKWFGAMDIGMDHPTVFLLVAVDRHNTVYVVDEYVSRNTPINEDARQIVDLIGDRSLSWPTVIDPSACRYTKASRLSVAEQYAMYGVETRPGIPTARYGEYNIVQEIKMRLRDQNILVCGACEHLIREFRTWSYKRDNAGKPLKREAFEDRNNDALDALRYLLTLRPVYNVPKCRVYLAEAG